MQFQISNRLRIVAEIIVVIFIELLAFHLVEERTATRVDPSGDEGSWMMVATQVASGQGFTTRWLEHPFLKPFQLPRPDDFRYPGLVLPLATVFKIGGISYQNALNLVTGIFLVFLLTIYLVCRVKFGIRTAVLTMVVSSISLLQLTWNSMVYTEGLFGIAVGVAILVSMYAEKKFKYSIWILLGIACSFVYYVRPNGFLLFAGLPAFMLWKNREKKYLIFPAISILVIIICLSPWFIRNCISFGNPSHIASNAGLLRGGNQDPLDLSFTEFIKRNGILFPLYALCIGMVRFFKDLDFFEHGLHIIPLAGVVAGLLRREQFYSKFAIAGLSLSFLSVSYVSYNYSWAGVRYFTPFLPFVYGYGIYTILSLFDLIFKKTPYSRIVAGCLSFVILVISVYYPHRYYERTLPLQRVVNREHQVYHMKNLEKMLTKDDTYLASSAMAGMAYQSPFRCISIHEYFDTSFVMPVMDRFNPKIIALTTQDTARACIKNILESISAHGYQIRLQDTLKNYLYYRIEHPER